MLRHAGGGDLHYIKSTLGHAGIAVTSDIYMNLLPQVDREVAEAAAKLVPMQRPKKIDSTPAHASLTQEASDEGSGESGRAHDKLPSAGQDPSGGG